MARRRSPGTPAGLDAGRVVDAATALVAEGGVEALSMRAVAHRLGVAPNALYSHVADKDALLDMVTDALLADPPVGGDAGWRVRLDALGRHAWGATRGHPVLAARLLQRGGHGPHLTALRDAARAAVAQAHVPPDRVDATLAAFLALVLGLAASGPDDGGAAVDLGIATLLAGLAR